MKKLIPGLPEEMTFEQRLAKEFLEDLIPRYMSAMLFDGMPDAHLRQNLFLDLTQFAKHVRMARPESAGDFERIIPTAEDAAAFMQSNRDEPDAAPPKPAPTKKRRAPRKKA